VFHLTIDVGTGNPGAIGMRFHTSNMGSVYDVAIRSSDPEQLGAAGLDLTAPGPGPGLVKNVEIEGFDVGIQCLDMPSFCMTFEHITLKNQRHLGIYVERLPVAIRGLKSFNAVPVLCNGDLDREFHGWGFVCLVDADLRADGGYSHFPAIENLGDCGLFVRNLSTEGYPAAIRSAAGRTTIGIPGPRVEEFSSHGVLSVLPGAAQSSLNLPIEETPEPPWGDPADWASVADYLSEAEMAERTVECADALQKAIDSGKSTVYFPNGSYRIAKTVYVRDNAILLMDRSGDTEAVYTLPKPQDGYWLHEPRPLRPRVREPVVPDHSDPTEATGRLVLADVLHGRSVEGVGPGEIKKLLVLELLPKPVGFGGVPHAMSWWGTLNFERILGTVPVEPDGSAHFEVPALRPIFFVALDENDMSVKRMQSFLSVMPGETLGCAGCHEQRTDTPRSLSKTALTALKRGPSPIAPIDDVPDLMDFPRDIQPILDEHCLRCHNDRRRDGGVNLSGDYGPIYSHAYWTLFVRGQVVDGRKGLGNRPPRTIGSSASRLMKLLDGSHYDAKPSPLQQKTIRLWIETGATYAGTYAALSTGNLYQGRIFLDFELGGDFAKILARRCGGCHRDELELQAKPTWDVHHIRKVRPRDVRFSEHLIYNFSRPERSLSLMAPLSREAGGDGLCKSPDASGEPDRPVVVFHDTRDADYQALLALIRTGKERLDERKRFDMPDFRPNEHYVREMQKYGVLPADLGPNDPVDPYATDRAYWQSLRHEGSAQ